VSNLKTHVVSLIKFRAREWTDPGRETPRKGEIYGLARVKPDLKRGDVTDESLPYRYPQKIGHNNRTGSQLGHPGAPASQRHSRGGGAKGNAPGKPEGGENREKSEGAFLGYGGNLKTHLKQTATRGTALSPKGAEV